MADEVAVRAKWNEVGLGVTNVAGTHLMHRRDVMDVDVVSRNRSVAVGEIHSTTDACCSVNQNCKGSIPRVTFVFVRQDAS